MHVCVISKESHKSKHKRTQCKTVHTSLSSRAKNLKANIIRDGAEIGTYSDKCKCCYAIKNLRKP